MGKTIRLPGSWTDIKCNNVYLVKVSANNTTVWTKTSYVEDVLASNQNINIYVDGVFVESFPVKEAFEFRNIPVNDDFRVQCFWDFGTDRHAMELVHISTGTKYCSYTDYYVLSQYGKTMYFDSFDE